VSRHIHIADVAYHSAVPKRVAPSLALITCVQAVLSSRLTTECGLSWWTDLRRLPVRQWI